MTPAHQHPSILVRTTFSLRPRPLRPHTRIAIWSRARFARAPAPLALDGPSPPRETMESGESRVKRPRTTASGLPRHDGTLPRRSHSVLLSLERDSEGSTRRFVAPPATRCLTARVARDAWRERLSSRGGKRKRATRDLLFSPFLPPNVVGGTWYFVLEYSHTENPRSRSVAQRKKSGLSVKNRLSMNYRPGEIATVGSQ